MPQIIMQPIAPIEVKKTSSFPIFLSILCVILFLALLGVGFLGFTKYEELNKKVNDLTAQNITLQAEITRLKNLPATEEGSDSEEVVDSNADWKTYEFEEDGFTIKYPKDVQVSFDSKEDSLYTNYKMTLKYENYSMVINSKVAGFGNVGHTFSSDKLLIDGETYTKSGILNVGSLPGEDTIFFRTIIEYPDQKPQVKYLIVATYELGRNTVNSETTKVINIFDSILKTIEFNK